MKKRIVSLVIAAAMVAVTFAGCTTTQTKSTEQGSSAAMESTTAMEGATVMEDTTAMADATAVEGATAMEELTTKATFKSQAKSEIDKDVMECVFEDSKGEEFVAIVGKDTKLPKEGLEEGKTYMLHHADMQTASLPPQLPQVYSIELVEE